MTDADIFNIRIRRFQCLHHLIFTEHMEEHSPIPLNLHGRMKIKLNKFRKPPIYGNTEILGHNIKPPWTFNTLRESVRKEDYKIFIRVIMLKFKKIFHPTALMWISHPKHRERTIFFNYFCVDMYFMVIDT